MFALLESMRTYIVATSPAGHVYPSGEYLEITMYVLILSRRANISC
jgi:hypothetical protein